MFLVPRVDSLYLFSIYPFLYVFTEGDELLILPKRDFLQDYVLLGEGTAMREERSSFGLGGFDLFAESTCGLHLI
jgi:hypothetical protein